MFVPGLTEDDQVVRRQFSKPHVCYAGAHEGCGCAFNIGRKYPPNRARHRADCRCLQRRKPRELRTKGFYSVPESSDCRVVARPKIQPRLAIFWVFRRRLLKADTPLERGIHTREAINGQFDHLDFWPVLQRLWPEFRGLQYEEVPRGRILFLKADRTFCVYMDKSLHTPEIKRLLLEEFDLPRAGTKFLTDPHYTTDPEELDRLFDEPIRTRPLLVVSHPIGALKTDILTQYTSARKALLQERLG